MTPKDFKHFLLYVLYRSQTIWLNIYFKDNSTKNRLKWILRPLWIYRVKKRNHLALLNTEFLIGELWKKPLKSPDTVHICKALFTIGARAPCNTSIRIDWLRTSCRTRCVSSRIRYMLSCNGSSWIRSNNAVVKER